ncbi:hypothetical protein F4810DRAFT_545228 [Camillea tinctor]|nr:hypothetical protein F4810DRAFT_545228 [Camillea tinctor]
MNGLKKDAATDSPRYSNADWVKFFKQPNIQGWETQQPHVHISRERTSIRATLQNGNNDEVRIHCKLARDFREACNDLSGFLLCFSAPIDNIFAKKTANPGEIRLETHYGESTIIYWVYHNVSVEIDLFAPRLSESVEHSEAHPDPVFKSLLDLADNLFDYIREGAVSTQEERSLPEIGKITLPSMITAGKFFDVLVEVDDRSFSHVNYEGDAEIVYRCREDTKEGRKFTFLARKPGFALIHFHFAHYDTLNYGDTYKKVIVLKADPNSKP